jgi:iron complex outermembrane receptor protein
MNLIDTPQSISVVTDEMLKLFDAQSPYNAVDMVPGASQGSNGYGFERIYLRGQYLNEPRVDGINNQTLQYVDSYALERVEIVRGPATVLYGITGAFGGELNQILKSPTDTFQGNFGVHGGDFALHRYEGDISGPVPGTDDRLKARLLGSYSTYGIPQVTVDPARDVSKLISGAVTYDFTPHTTASLHFYHSKQNLDATDGCPLAQTPNNVIYIPTSIPVKRWYCNDPKQSKQIVDNSFEIAGLKHVFSNDWTLETKVAHAKSDIGPLDYVFGFGPAGRYPNPHDVYLYSYQAKGQQVSTTATLSLGGKFDLFGRTQQFFAALEEQKEDKLLWNYHSFGLGFMNLFTGGGLGILSDGSPIPPIPSSIYLGDSIADDKTYIASVQILLNPVNRLDVLAGLLFQRTQLEQNNYTITPPQLQSLTESKPVPRLGITYGLVPEKGEWLTDAKVYFSFADGYEPNIGYFSVTGKALTDPQRMQSLEVGLKTSWLDNRLAASVDVYDSYVTKTPTAIFGAFGSSGGTLSFILGDKNTFRGGELEMLGQILPGWNVDLNYSYINAQQHSYLFPQTLAVANVPKQQAALFTSYEFLKGPLKGLSFGGAAVWKKDVALLDNAVTIFQGNYNPSNQVQWSATRLDLRASYKDFSGHLQGLEIFGNVYNVNNSRSFASTGGSSAFSNTVGAPRTITGGVRYSF